MRSLLVCASVLLCVSCAPTEGFVCEADPQCVRGAEQGVCQAVGYCSFADPSCPTGQRFGDHAGGDLGGACVTVDDRDAGRDAADPDARRIDGGELDPDASTIDAGLDAAIDAGPDAAVDAAPDATIDAGGPILELTFAEIASANVHGVTTDTWINSELRDRNYGKSLTLRVDGDPPRRALIRFTLTAIPRIAEVVSAELRLYTTVDGALPTGRVVAFPLLEAWEEGTADDATGTASFNRRTAADTWAAAGAAPPSRGTTTIGEIVPSSNETAYFMTLDTDVVGGWVTEPDTNNGVILMANDAGDESAIFVAREGQGARRPLLKVRYRLP